MQSFVLHFPPLHVQTWIWSKSSHRFAKLFFLFRHFNLFYASPSSKISIQLSFWWLFECLQLQHVSSLFLPPACPPGTYKPEGAAGGLSTCLPCPDLQHTSQPGSTSLSDCVCKPGYQPVGMTCQSKWNWSDIWFTPLGLNPLKHRWLLLTVSETCFWLLSTKAFTFVPVLNTECDAKTISAA